MFTQRLRLIVSCSILLGLACPISPAMAQEAAEAAPAVKKREGKIVAGPRNIRQFNPDDVSNVVDATDINLRRVFEDIGPDATLWYQHVLTLSNPFFEGRAPASRGGELAADYVEFYFREYGLEPAFAPRAGDAKDNADKPGGGVNDNLTSFRQDFDFESPDPKVEMINTAAAIGDVNLASGEDYVVLGVSGSASVTAPVTFVGYGIDRGQDDYTSFAEDTDLTGRIAIVMRYEPLNDEGHSQWAEARFSRFAGIRNKLSALADRHAAGIILVNPPGAVDGATGLETLQQSTRFGRRLDIPVVQMTPEAVNRLLAAANSEHDLLGLRKAADAGEVKTVNLADNVKVTLSADLHFDDRMGTQNVGAILPGKGDLADQWIIVGAHYDHVGFGYTGAMPNNVGKLHPGADDNASGTAGLLITAKRLAHDAETWNDEHRRSILFLAFGAEEAGLFGSDFFIEHSSVPADKIYAMINMDMIGRLRSHNLLVGGMGSAKEFSEWLRPHFLASGLTISEVASGRGPSDHSNFFTAGVPVLFMFTGEHDDYHTPADRGYTVNPIGAVEIIDLVEAITLDLATREEQLTYVARPGAGGGNGAPAAASAPPAGGGAPNAPRVRLGVMPAYNADLETGVAVESVGEESAADAAGILAGDVLLAWNGEELTGGRKLSEMLAKAEPGEVVKITVQRGDKNMVLEVTLKPRD